jgi:glyoxylase-like metal-dependent hydrolase (beta-lactamase superfamily II)
VWEIQVPIPDNPLKYVLCYAVEAGDGLVLVDTGWNDEGSFLALSQGLASFGAALTDVRGIVVTHVHPDHYGLAGRVKEVSDAWVALHPADAEQISPRYDDVERILQANARWLLAAGAPEQSLTELRDAGLELQRYVMVSRPDRLMVHGDRVGHGNRHLEVIHTPGHTRGHVCLHDPSGRLLFGGDHLLPRISPNVGFHPLSGPNPLGDFLESLDQVSTLDVDLVLPGHEYAFTDLAGRTHELTAHHRARLDEVRAILASGETTAWDVTVRLTWSRPWEALPWYLRRAALGEGMAHLVYLLHEGDVERADRDPQLWRLTTTEGARAPASGVVEGAIRP